MARTVRGSRGFDTHGAHDVVTTVTAQPTGGTMNRLTNAQFSAQLGWTTTAGRKCGALQEGEWIGTQVAWSMSYLCVFDANGRMVDDLRGRCGTMRNLYEYARAMESAWLLSLNNPALENV
jgi:hypothetical protein